MRTSYAATLLYPYFHPLSRPDALPSFSGATLVLFTDCHNPDADEAEKIYNGPYLVHGRPRVAEVTWRRSNIGGADVLLRFDAADARLVLARTDDGDEWTGTHTLLDRKSTRLNSSH